MKKYRNYLAAPYVLWILLFTILPLTLIIFFGFTKTTSNGLVFTLENVSKIIDPVNLKALWLAMLLALASTVICLLLAYPLAFILSNSRVSKNSLMIFLFTLPMWMNGLLRIYAWQTLLEKNGVINTMLGFFGLGSIQVINTPYAIIIGMVYNFLPFMVLPIYNVLIKIDNGLIHAAEDLGANKFITFKNIIFPLSLPGVISGITMVFVPAFTTFFIPDILGGGKVQMIGNVIEQEFKMSHNWNVGSGLSIVLMVMILISLIPLSANKGERGMGLW